MALSKFTKATIGGTTATAGGVSTTHLATRSHVSLEEVDKKLVNENVNFHVEVGKPNTDVLIEISVKEDGKAWKKDGGYSWSCTVTKPPFFQISKKSFDTRLSLYSGEKTRKNLKQKLVEVCSKGKTETSNKKQVAGSFVFLASNSVEVNNLIWQLIWNYGDGMRV